MPLLLKKLLPMPMSCNSLLVIFAMLMTACTSQPVQVIPPSAPMPENMLLEAETQKQIHASRHWQLVAQDMADQLIKTIDEKKLSQHPFYIFAQTRPTAFTRAFNDFLITTLVNKGVKVSDVKQGSYVYNYKIQLVEYNSLRSTVVSEHYKFSSLAAGIVVARNVGEVLGVDGSLLAGGVLLDAVDMNIAPNLEIIITSSILNRHLFISRSTDIYYANALDKHLYQPATQGGKASDVFNDPFYRMK